MINVSGLEEYLAGILEDHCIGDAQLLPVAYAGMIYILSQAILVIGPDSLYFRRMNMLREIIEHEFGLYTILWKKLQLTHTIKSYNNSSNVVKRTRVVWVITNCYTYLNENTVVTARFGISPPSLEEYLGQFVEPFDGDIDNILDGMIHD